MKTATQMLHSLLAAYVLTTAVAHPINAAGSDTVQLPFGSIRGNLNEASREFLGVPYATARRFEAPQQWSQQYPHGVLDATSHAPQCPQLYPTPGTSISEDCLFLNIFTPLGQHLRRNTAPLPVLLWVHGGGLLIGSAMDPVYNGSAIASEQGVIVVPVNYRLGLLGFSAFNSSSVSTNNGFRDQMASCEWVRRHISAFGGDFTKITIFGESVGGQGVLALLTSPLSRGLFQGAIAESPGHTNTVTLEERIAHTAAILSHTTCDTNNIGCLQALNYTELIHTIDSNTESLGRYDSGGRCQSRHSIEPSPGRYLQQSSLYAWDQRQRGLTLYSDSQPLPHAG